MKDGLKMRAPTIEKDHPSGLGGIQRLYDFTNGYGASVVCYPHSYGGKDGLWELAVLHDDRIVYDTPIAGDVIGHLSNAEVEELLDQIEALPPREVVE